MLKTRVMPCLLINNERLVKTVKFKNPSYVGDPVNAIKIYNEKEVDELIIVDISATVEKRPPPFRMIAEITDECFMPLCYGGGIRSVENIKTIFASGVEKVAINSYAVENPFFVRQAAEIFGSQSIVLCLDVKKTLLGRHVVCTHSGRNVTKLDPAAFAGQMEEMGAGEILLNSIDRDGTWEGYDLELIEKVACAVSIPVIALGGAGHTGHFSEAVQSGASACAAGSMVVYQGKDKGVLINFPTRDELKKVLGDKV
jgi:imidazole glycerol-phosphate synthase subunit HisF